MSNFIRGRGEVERMIECDSSKTEYIGVIDNFWLGDSEDYIKWFVHLYAYNNNKIRKQIMLKYRENI